MLAIWVVVHHLTGKGRMLDGLVSSLADPLQRVVESGYVAVGTFFVLSGFVLARSYTAVNWNRTTLLRYAVARYARVYPVYLLSLVIMSPIMFVQLFWDTPALTTEKAAVLAEYGFVLQGWAQTLRVHWNTPAWSLSCELFFYLCFPLVVIALKNVRGRGMIAVVAATIAMPAALRMLDVPTAWKPLMHLGDFVVGIACSGIYDRVARSGHWIQGRGYWLYAPAAGLAIWLIAMPQALSGLCTLNVALRPLNAVLLLGLAMGGGLPWRALATERAMFLGKTSYSMYILHIPLLWWYKRTWFYLSGSISQTAAAAIYIVGVMIVSAIVWERVEEPANRWIRRWATARMGGAPPSRAAA